MERIPTDEGRGERWLGSPGYQCTQAFGWRKPCVMGREDLRKDGDVVGAWVLRAKG